jgi:hypothetical protein
MMRYSGVLSFNFSMNGGEFVQPHFQIREFWRPQNTFGTPCITVYMFLLALPYLSVMVSGKTDISLSNIFLEGSIHWGNMSIEIAQLSLYTLLSLKE